MKLKHLIENKISIKFLELKNLPELTFEIQLCLQDDGHKINADKVFGDKTQNALIQFARVHKINLGGNKVTPELAVFLLKSAASPRTISLVSVSQVEHIFQASIYPSDYADLNQCLLDFGIDTVEEIRQFLATCSAESGGLRYFEELASGLDYEFRTDLGNVNRGDGALFKGAGAIQVTGRGWAQKFSNWLESKGRKDPLVMLQGCKHISKTYPFEISGFWWVENDMNYKINKGQGIYETSVQVNGGDPPNGWHERLSAYNRALEVI